MDRIQAQLKTLGDKNAVYDRLGDGKLDGSYLLGALDPTHYDQYAAWALRAVEAAELNERDGGSLPHVTLRVPGPEDPTVPLSVPNIAEAKSEVEACIGYVIGKLDPPHKISGEAVGFKVMLSDTMAAETIQVKIWSPHLAVYSIAAYKQAGKDYGGAQRILDNLHMTLTWVDMETLRKLKPREEELWTEKEAVKLSFKLACRLGRVGYFALEE